MRENDTGPDDANHAKMGIAIMAGPGMPTAVAADALAVRHRADRADRDGLPVPADMQGRSLV